MKTSKILAIVLGLLTIAACNSGSNKAKESASEVEEVSVEQIVEDLENIPTPSPTELIELMNKSGVPYTYYITNTLANQQNYLSTKQKALNLGVYSADLCYDAIYQKTSETEEYLKCILMLASDLNISIDADKITEQVEQNINNGPALVTSIKDILKESQYILNQTSQTDIALDFLIGSWVESAYICIPASENSHFDSESQEIVMNHFEYVGTILKYMESRKNDPSFSELYQSLSNIKTLTDEVKADWKNTGKRDALATAIKDLRNGIV